MQLDVKFNSPLWQTLPSKIDMHLNDKHCKPFLVNSSHVLIKTSHYNCGTKSKVTRNHIIFTNTFIAREETGAGQVVSFFPDVEVAFRCTYDRKRGMFVVSTYVIQAPLSRKCNVHCVSIFQHLNFYNALSFCFSFNSK